jgi:N-acetyl sugar amidotransferase
MICMVYYPVFHISEGWSLMRWCKKCILPDTRPNLTIGSDGICNACHSHDSKPNIDWQTRANAFDQVARHAQRRGRGYDCLIPVSGGKDSTWQVVKCLEYGLNPLAVTWKTPGRTDIGSRNLENLISLGVDHIDYQVNPKVESKFMRLALERFGDPAIPMHMALFSIPLRLALKFEIPLVVWGENSAFEYGGKEEEATGFQLDEVWLKEYGVTNGTSAADWVCDQLSVRELTPYFGPTHQELEQGGVLAVFLGYYFPWDPRETLAVASSHGFRPNPDGPKTGYYDFADIDDHFISIHHYLKWYKFGFTRLFDNLSLEIRNGRMSRPEALQIVCDYGEQTPYEDIDKFCEFVSYKNDEFFNIIEKFRNLDIWSFSNGRWRIQDFLLPDWSWK